MAPMRRLLLAVFLGTSAAACTSSGGPTVSPTASPAVNATRAPLLPTSVYALPDVTFAGYERLLSELRGTPVVVYVWGSWCGPCRQDGPRLAAAGRR